MALRQTSAAMLEAAKGFRRLEAYKQLSALRTAWQPTKPSMLPTAPLNRLRRPRNLPNRQCLPNKF
jgi:hypothetical protein